MLAKRALALTRKDDLLYIARAWRLRSNLWRRKGVAGPLAAAAAEPSPLPLARAPAVQWDMAHARALFEAAGVGLSGERVVAQGSRVGIFPISTHSGLEYRAVARLCGALNARACASAAAEAGSQATGQVVKAYQLQWGGSCQGERILAQCGSFLDGMAAVLQAVKARVAADGAPCADAHATLRCAEDEWDRALDNAHQALALLRMLLARSRLEDGAEAFAAVLRDVIATCAHSLAVASRSYDTRAAWAEQAITAAAEGRAQLVAPPVVGTCDVLARAMQQQLTC